MQCMVVAPGPSSLLPPRRLLQAPGTHLGFCGRGRGKEVGVAAAGHTEHASSLLGAGLWAGAVDLHSRGTAGAQQGSARHVRQWVLTYC